MSLIGSPYYLYSIDPPIKTKRQIYPVHKHEQ